MNSLHNVYKKTIFSLVGNYIWRLLVVFFLIWNLQMRQISEGFLLFTAANKAEFLLYALAIVWGNRWTCSSSNNCNLTRSSLDWWCPPRQLSSLLTFVKLCLYTLTNCSNFGHLFSVLLLDLLDYNTTWH